MTRQESFQQNLEVVRAHLQSLAKFQPIELAREDELGKALSLRPAAEAIVKLKDLYGQVDVTRLDQLGLDALRNLRSYLESLSKIVDALRKFKADQPDAPTVRNELIDSTIAHCDSARDSLIPLLTVLRTPPSDQVEAAKSQAAAKIEAEAQLREIQRIKKEATDALMATDGVLREARKTSEQTGVEDQAGHFGGEATRHDGHAVKWLVAVICCGAALLAYSAFCMYSHRIPCLAPADTYQAVQFAVAKGLGFATLGFFTVFSGRAYAAHRHNSVVNTHRSNALKTYTVLVNAGREQANRDIVLTKAADCIFAPQPSGYGKSEGGEQLPVSLVTVAASAAKPPA